MSLPRNILQKCASFLRSKPLRRTYFLVALAFPFLIALACWIDGTWTLPKAGKGFSQYYGFWTIFITTPIILVLTERLFDTFIASIQNWSVYCIDVSEETGSRIEKLTQKHVKSLCLQSPSAWVLVIMMVVAFYRWQINVVTTRWPIPLQTFNHDVFDSSAHLFGFYITRAYNFFTFVFVYAPAIFVVLHVTWSMVSILRYVCRDDVLRINFFHPDNCGGTSIFGNINLLILTIYINFFAVSYVMYITHGRAYQAIILSSLTCFVLVVSQSIGAVYYIHKAVRQKKAKCIDEIIARLNQRAVESLRTGKQFPNDLLAFRTHVMGIHTFPYTAPALVIVNVIRFLAPALGVLSFFKIH
jgi:hypothetical protein